MEKEIVDLEKERKEKENTPEGKKAKKVRMYLKIAAAVIFFSAIYVITHNPNARKDMVTLSVQGIEIVPGDTKVQEILEGGFQLAEQQVQNIIDPEVEAEANSYYTLIQIVKDNKSYGTLTIANDSSLAQALPKCTVLNISVYDSDESAEEVTADGVAMGELTYEDLVSKYGEPATSEENIYIGGTNMEWENKGYYFRANVGEDGKIHHIESSYGRH